MKKRQSIVLITLNEGAIMDILLYSAIEGTLSYLALLCHILTCFYKVVHRENYLFLWCFNRTEETEKGQVT